MSDTRNHTIRDQLAAVIAARRIRGCDHNGGISACARCTADALLESDAIAAVRAAAWDEGHKTRWRRGPDKCRCYAFSVGECGCGLYGTGELISLHENPYRADTGADQ